MVATKGKKMIDLHCHILPEIDDGAKTVEDSIALLQEEQNQGVSSIIFTPHFNFERTTLENFCQARKESLQRLDSELKLRNISIPLKCGAEVYFSPYILEEDIKPLCLGQSEYILIELPTNIKPYGFERTMEELIRRGYTPILAHIERYPYFSEDMDIFYNLVMKGCLAQVNAGTIIKYPSSLSLAMRCIKCGMVHIVCSDCHSIKKRPPNLKAAFSIIERKLGKAYVDWLIKNSEDIFKGRYLDIPIVKKPRSFWGKWF